MGITKSYDTAFATGLATTFVLALAAVISHLIYHGILVPLDLTYLNIILFIVVIAGLVQLIQVYLHATSPGFTPTVRHLPAPHHQQLRGIGRDFTGHQSRSYAATNTHLRHWRCGWVHAGHGLIWCPARAVTTSQPARSFCRHADRLNQRRPHEPGIYGLSRHW